MSSRHDTRPVRTPLLARGQEAAEYVSGQVDRITYHDAESGFCVLRVALHGRREPATVVGHAAQVAVGEHVHATGAWVQDRTHGQQFKADWIRVSPPDSPEGIERYLGSGLIKGIGPHLAKQLVGAFGVAVFDVIDREPDRLLDIAGIGRVRARRIVENWQGQRAVREIMVFLHTHGVSTSRAVRIHRTYGADAVKVLTEDPYRLARDIRGIGFLTADQIARQIGVPLDAMGRRRGALLHVLSEAVDQGHCALPTSDLRERTATLVALAPTLIDEALALETDAGTLIATSIDGTSMHALASLDASERAVADATGRHGRPGAAVAGHRRGARHPVGRGQAVAVAVAQPAHRRGAGARVARPRDHGWSWRRQDHRAPGDPRHPHGQGRAAAARRADRARGQADDRGDRPRGADHPPPPRDQPAGRALPPRDRAIRSRATCWWWTSRRWSTSC